jgi:tetratricopeptide (TPR) repeat protein
MRARLILLAAGLIAFGASLGSSFHFDDYAIFSDPALESPRGWLEVWAPLKTRPLTYFTFWLNRQLGAGDPLGYHLFNLLFHLAGVLLAWECLRRLLPERTALIAAVLFALHPMQAEAVNYVWARGIVLAGAFCFAALWQWIEGRPWIALGWFALALLAKEECAAFPLLLVWLDWRGSLRGKFPAARRSLPALAAMFALALAAGARVIWATSVIPGAPAGLEAGISPWNYLLVQGAVICRYLQLVAAPYGFTVDPDISVHLLAGMAAWALLLGVTFWLLRRERDCATWWIAGLILLIPSSSVFPAADVSADRRMYLPMFAFAAAAALLLARVKAPAVLAAIALLLVGLSVQRTMVWMTEESLWREAVARAPKKLRPKLQLARTLPAARGLELLAQARLDAPYDPAVATETGKILLGEGQPDGALQEFGRALALAPMDARNMNNRGVALLALGQSEAARADFERALRADPSLTEARENLAKLPPKPE